MFIAATTLAKLMAINRRARQERRCHAQRAHRHDGRHAIYPSSITVKRGETVRFIVANSGKLKHEMVLGAIGDLKRHADLMRKNPAMEHAEENMVSVDPGRSGELIWKYTAAGKVDFACLQPGHFEAGMKGKVAVK